MANGAQALEEGHVPRVRDITPSRWEQAFQSFKGEPLSLTGLCEDWPLVQGSPIQNMRSIVGGETVTAMELRYNSPRAEWSHVTPHESSFSQFVHRLENEPPGSSDQLEYLQWRKLPVPGQSRLEKGAVAQLTEQICLPTVLCEAKIVEVAWWIGRCRSSSIHFDAKDIVHCVLQGQKCFYLWSPWKITQFEMLPLTARDDMRPIAAPTAYSVEDIDSKCPPPCARVIVDAGDAIYIPMGWFHEVITVNHLTVSCNFWFEPAAKSRFRPTSMFLSSTEYLQFCKTKESQESDPTVKKRRME